MFVCVLFVLVVKRGLLSCCQGSVSAEAQALASRLRLLIRHSLTMSHKLNITIYYLLVSFDCASLQWPVTSHFIPSELHYLKVDYNNPGLIPKSRTPLFFLSLLLCVVVKYKISHIWHWQTWEWLPWWRAGEFWWGWVTGLSSALLWLADLSLAHDQRHSHMVPSNSMMEKRCEAQVPTSDSYWRSALCHPHLVLVMALCTQIDAHTACF